jgi:hypothetical protein
MLQFPTCKQRNGSQIQRLPGHGHLAMAVDLERVSWASNSACWVKM